MILLLEDSQSKAEAISNVIKNVINLQNNEFDVATDINTAKQKLQEKKFNLFIVDIQVPIRFGEKPEKDGGLKLIHKLVNETKGYFLPNHIIAITEYESIFNEYKKTFGKKLITFIEYKDNGTAWANKLKDKISYIHKSTDESNTIINYQYDLAIICALDDPEFKQIELLSDNWKPVKKSNTSLPFQETIFKYENKELKVIAIPINKMGMVPSAVLSTQIIELFRPKYLVMTGIAAGIEDEVKLGDILIANPSWDSGSGKLKKDKDGNKIFDIDPKQETLDGDIEHNILKLKKDKAFLNKIREGWTSQEISNVLNVHVGAIASGAAVIADNEITEKIKKQSRNMIGIEMEAYGVMYAAKHATKPKPIPIIIKSVCDFADEEKNDGFQNYAAYTSARFLYEFAKRYI